MAALNPEIPIPTDARCILCGRMATGMWTIDNMVHACVTYLCGEHSAPVAEVLAAAGDIPPEFQIPVPDRVVPEEPEEKPRPSRLVPLTSWTPPDEGFIGPINRPAPQPEMSPEEILVKTAREEGRTWQEIADVLGMTRQNVWFKYRLKYGTRGARKQAVS